MVPLLLCRRSEVPAGRDGSQLRRLLKRFGAASLDLRRRSATALRSSRSTMVESLPAKRAKHGSLFSRFGQRTSSALTLRRREPQKHKVCAQFDEMARSAEIASHPGREPCSAHQLRAGSAPSQDVGAWRPLRSHGERRAVSTLRVWGVPCLLRARRLSRQFPAGRLRESGLRGWSEKRNRRREAGSPSYKGGRFTVAPCLRRE